MDPKLYYITPSSDLNQNLIFQGELQCNLFGHDDIIPATALKGNCYRLLGAVVIPLEVEVKEQVKKVIIDDGSLDKLTSKGNFSNNFFLQ